MHIIFDLMGTVLGSADYTLRPGIRETIDVLRANGYVVDFWTGGPVEIYSRLLKEKGIDGDLYAKTGALPFNPALCVDDEPQDWMPGKVVKVNTYFSEELPAESISAVDLIRKAFSSN